MVLGSDEFIQDLYMEKWRDFMEKNVSSDEIDEKWLPSYYEEDRPTKLLTHLDMLKDCGFSNIDVIYKFYNYAVYTAKIRKYK